MAPGVLQVAGTLVHDLASGTPTAPHSLQVSAQISVRSMVQILKGSESLLIQLHGSFLGEGPSKLLLKCCGLQDVCVLFPGSVGSLNQLK